MFWKINQISKSTTKSSEKIMAVEVDKTFTRNDKCAKILKSFLSNQAKNLKIPYLSHPTLKAIFKHMKNPSITDINDATDGRTF